MPEYTLTPWRSWSPSQVTTWRGCPRRWWFEKVAGFRQPPSPSQVRGLRIHAQLEAYLLKGTVPEEAAARAGLEHLPPGGSVPRECVERRIKTAIDGAPVPVSAIIDLVEQGRVSDHKTTSDFRYMKTPEALAADSQCVTYCAWAVREQNAASMAFRHIYYRTRGRPESAVVEVVTTPASRARTEGLLRKDLWTMAEHAKATCPADVPPNVASCRAFGGCPHAVRCAGAGARTAGFMSGLIAAKGALDNARTEPFVLVATPDRTSAAADHAPADHAPARGRHGVPNGGRPVRGRPSPR